MRIGLSMRESITTSHPEVRDALSRDWIDLVGSWGCLPVLIPNTHSNPETYVKELDLDLVILTGGNSLTPQLSGIEASDYSKARDLTETRLIQFCQKTSTPLFGICRGLQMIHCFFSGKLTTADPKIHVAQNHRVDIVSVFWQTYFGHVHFNLNSFHNYGVPQNNLSGELDAIAISPDQLVEAVCHKEKPILGFMWHPERANPDKMDYVKLIQDLVHKKAFWNQSKER